MRATVIILALVSALCLTGCDKDRKSGGSKPKPAPTDAQKVPDAPSGLQLSAIAAAAIVAYATGNYQAEKIRRG